MTSLRFIILIVFWLGLLCPAHSHAQEPLRAAVCANYIQPFREIAAAFEKQTGVKVQATFASSGSLYGQIINGAPYDIFLSADEDRPGAIYKKDIGEKPFVYARGRLVLWSPAGKLCSAAKWQEAVATGKTRIAIANPETAPYGQAARLALQRAGIWEGLKGRIVYAQDISQAFQYADTGAVAGAFCAFSSIASTPAKNKGCYFEIREAPDIVQSATILKRAANRNEVRRFAAFLVSSEAQLIRKKHGYT